MQWLETVNGRPQLNIGGMIIKAFNAEEIFARRNQKPYLVLSGTGGGKTVMSVDIFRACLNSGFNQFNYLTTTFNSGENTFVRNQIIKACVVQRDHINKLIEIIEECERSQEKQIEIENMLVTTAESMMNSEEKDVIRTRKQHVLHKMINGKYSYEFLSKQICQNCDEAQNYLTQIFKTAKDPFQFKQNMEMLKGQIVALLQDQHTDLVQFKGEEVSKIFVLGDWGDEITKQYKEFEEELKAMSREILRNKIKPILNENQDLLAQYQMNGKTQNQRLQQLLPLVEDPRKLCLLVDDISHIIAQAGTKQKTICGGKEMSEKEAFQSIFNRIFNQGRHLGTIIIALHQTGVLDSKLVPFISNVIVNQSTNLGSNRNLFIMQGEQKNIVQRILDKIGLLNKEAHTNYNLICYKDYDQSPDPKSKYIIYNANYQNTPQFNLGMYSKAPYFYKLAEMQMRHQYGDDVAKQAIQQQPLQIPPKEQQQVQKQKEESEEEYSGSYYSDYDESLESGSESD